jgi:tetratricopeptide (TPR) repeat protein
MHVIVLALALTLASVPQTAAPPPANPPVATSQQLERLIRDGKADEAVTKGRPAVAAHPDDVELRLALARALAAQARHAKRQVNVTLSKEDTDRGEVKVKDADLRAATLRVDYDPAPFNEALEQLDVAIRRAPERLDLRVFQCFLLTDSGQIDRAKTAITNALQALPKNATTAKMMTAYGAERAKRGDPAGGAELLSPVAKAFPDDAAILVDYANVLTRLGRKYEAYNAFDRATLLAPKDARYARTKAIGAMLLRDYRRARSAYAAVYGLDPAASATLMRELVSPAASSEPQVVDLANAFVRAGKAGASSDEAMKLARSLLASQQFVFAIPVLDRAIKASPSNTEAKAMFQTVYRELGCESLAK